MSPLSPSRLAQVVGVGGRRHSIPDQALRAELWGQVVKLDRVPPEAAGKVDTPCWMWTGLLRPDGYGQIADGSHRVAYRAQFGPIPRGKWVLHRCDMRRCVRHLFLGDATSNTADMVSKARHSHGASHPQVRLTERQVLEIRRTPRSLRMALAKSYGVRVTTIDAIQRGKTWRTL